MFNSYKLQYICSLYYNTYFFNLYSDILMYFMIRYDTQYIKLVRQYTIHNTYHDSTTLISRTETEYMGCNLKNRTHLKNFKKKKGRNCGEVKIENQEIPNSEQFHYLSLIINKDLEVGDNVTHRISVSWLKWKSAYGIWIPTK